MKVLITGANGFVGKNLRVRLAERDDVEVISFTRDHAIDELSTLISNADFVFHLAGVNRPKAVEEFKQGNTELTKALCAAIEFSGKKIPVIYSSSIQAVLDNSYGESKLAAEQVLLDFSERAGNPVYIFRLPNVFGKWCKPNYNSAVATFCHNVAHNLPVQINDPSAVIRLVYVDDVLNRFISIMDGPICKKAYCVVEPVYEITVGDLVEKINTFKLSRENLITERVGTGLDRALHSTYLSYLPPEGFSYALIKHGDERGVFIEMLKTKDSGQFSYFTAHPGITRGGHYHHSKTEKFLVIKGAASFRFRNIISDEFYELKTSGDNPVVVETVPGWTHDITNIGHDEMLVMLWANEIFDRDSPDTYAKPL
ncbi:MAG: capsular polysaccharide biosynthesis protein CapF [Colwelliaceae bacterium]|nr:capsular polysaccharide biosynthesis protein CapF [Colwelliaceae bacterium]